MHYDFAPNQAFGALQLAFYAHVHHGQAGPGAAAEGVDGAAALQKVADLDFHD